MRASTGRLMAGRFPNETLRCVASWWPRVAGLSCLARTVACCAGPLLRDGHDAATLYAGFSLSPYGEMWRRAEQGGSLLAHLDPLSLAGGLAFLVLVLVLGIAATRWLSLRFRDGDSAPRFR